MLARRQRPLAASCILGSSSLRIAQHAQPLEKLQFCPDLQCVQVPSAGYPCLPLDRDPPYRKPRLLMLQLELECRQPIGGSRINQSSLGLQERLNLPGAAVISSA